MVTYHEYILKKKKTVLDFALYLVIPVVCAILAYVLSMVFLGVLTFLGFLVPAVVVGACYLAYKLMMLTNIEYEYLLTDSDLDIDKIINKTKRKHMVSVYRKDIISMAPLGSKNLPEGTENLPKIDATPYKDCPGTFVLVAVVDGEQKAIYFCPTQIMIETMEKRNPRKVFTN